MPAEKIAVPPEVHPAVALVPVELVLQKLSAPHVPDATVLELPPLFVPFASQ
ncbi:MAG TPA: hypothetical protein VGM58_08690 [Verrucomicrobiae bacterium]